MPKAAHQPLRVLYVDYSLGFGGAIKSLSLTLSRFANVDPLIVTTQDPEIIDTWLGDYRVRTFRRLANYREMGRRREWLNRAVPALLRWPLLKAIALADVLTTAKNIVWFMGLLLRQRIELVHLNNGFIPLEVILAAKVLRVPVIAHLRGFEEERGRLRAWSTKNVQHVVTVSAAVADSLLEWAPVSRSRVTAVHDPVDMEKVVVAGDRRDSIRARHGFEPDDIVFGIFGRVINWKGQLVFAKAAIRAMRQDHRVRAIVVGDESDGGRDYIREIRELIASSGFENRFVLAGYTPDVEAYYAAVDVVVHASIEPEPFGMVVPEAMAAGRAVIAADAGGPREVVSHGVDGLLVAPGDDEALAIAMLRLAESGEERVRLGRRGFDTAVRNFGIPMNVQALQSVYDILVPGTASRVDQTYTEAPVKA